MSVNWCNPYDKAVGVWRKGSLHTHTPNPRSTCGSVPMDELVRIYEGMGYSFMAVTNHDIQTDVTKFGGKSFVVLPGIEIDINGGRHFGVVHTEGASIFYDPAVSQQEMIDRNAAAGALVTLHHPDWQLREHYTTDELMALNNYDGIEIYNSVIENLEGAALSTAKWDRLLAVNRRVLGFANQDFHDYPHAVDCCNVVRTSDASPRSILDALKNGQFYCRYGVTISNVGRKGDTVFVETDNARLIRFIGLGGVVSKKEKAAAAEITFKPEKKYGYVRVECLGEGDEISFTQPFFRE